MRRDDDMAAKCGAWGAGILAFVAIVALALAVGIVTMYATEGDIRG